MVWGLFAAAELNSVLCLGPVSSAEVRLCTGWLSSATLNVKVIPVLEDNYMYLVIKEHTWMPVAKDMTMPKRQLEIVGWKGVSLTTILTIHHHGTKSKDMQRWSYLWPGLVLDANEHICALTHRLEHGALHPPAPASLTHLPPTGT
ncbi:hydroxyacylglutathione hydrolase-like protein [Phyllostomus hastatus]|uniref:hydroxyacylglutathione hydrolase-like protein n=1 Tax=Phyllostomus hastatus TaxID=9423 RepID=UPI001E682E77|nr:hydroxyacylglutathione hydrolase-like protein [Phyllostomus hastatus]